MSKRRLADELRLRTNPHYDHDVDPEENEFQFWNPVSATNDLIKLANSALEIAQVVSDAMTEKVQVKVQRKILERKIESLESQLLVEEPASPSETKTTKLVTAAIQRRAAASGRGEELYTLKQQLADLESREVELEGTVDTGMMWAKANEKVSENIKTALSFYKDERKRAYGQ
jgi:hypothetical protein